MPPKISRRELLKGGAKAAAALSVLPALGGDAEAQRRDVPRRRAARPAARAGGAFARLDEYVERHMRETGAPGMTLALADRAGRVRVFVAGHVALGVAYAVLVAPAAGALTVVLCLAMLGCFYAATDGVLAAMGSALAAPEVRGSGLAALATVTNVARLGASVAFGGLWTAFGLTAALAVFGVGLVASLAAAAPLLARRAAA